MQRAQGFAEQGAGQVFTAGVGSTTLVQTSFPGATVTVFLAGTTTLAVLSADNHTTPTPLSNPFTTDVNGHWFFYAANGRYDVMLQAPGLASWTMGDILLYDPAD